MATVNTGHLIGLQDRMRAARLLAGLEQAQIAAMLGVARTTVSAWEQGKTEPSASSFVGWAQVTGQSLEWLAEGMQKAPAEAGASVRPKGLEPLTFWFVVAAGLMGGYLDRPRPVLALVHNLENGSQR